jgi:hypothetical protein
MFYYDENGEGIKSVADAIREKAGITEELTFPDEFVSEIPYGIPKQTKIKYIIPATLTVPEATYGFDKVPFTFTRENINQLFNVNWILQDVPVSTTAGYWIQNFAWRMAYEGNYDTQHMVWLSIFGAGKAGQFTQHKPYNMPKKALTQAFEGYKFVGSNETYAYRGRNFKGLIFIYDSSYDGAPIVDETKLSQFFTCDYITAGW